VALSSPTLLLVEDDAAVSASLQRRLRFEGFSVHVAERGETALELLAERGADLVLLDLMLPGLDGFTVAERIRDVSNVPILMLTARDSVEDRVSGLERGADDYLVKPFELPELLARIRALLRRARLVVEAEPRDDDEVAFAGISLHCKTRQVVFGGEAVELTPREFDLLEYFLRHPRQVLTRDQLLSGVWGYDSDASSNLVDVYVLQLRKKLEARAGVQARRIETVRGVGYSLRDPSEGL
jgi:two-component system response regulator MprA